MRFVGPINSARDPLEALKRTFPKKEKKEREKEENAVSKHCLNPLLNNATGTILKVINTTISKSLDNKLLMIGKNY